MKIRRRALLFVASVLGAAGLLSEATQAQSSPYNLPRLPSPGQHRIYGGSVTQVPTANGGPNTAAQFAWMHTQANWASVFANWVTPYFYNLKRRGCNHVRFINACDAVLDSLCTQTELENHWNNDIIPLAKSLGMTLSTAMYCSATGEYSNFYYGGTFTNAQLWAPVQSFINNVVNANLSTFAYIEAGMQETSLDTTNEPISVYLANQAGAITTCPLGISSFEYPGFSWITTTSVPLTATIPLLLVHMYPQLNGFPATLQGALTQLEALLQGSGGSPTPWFLIEEDGYNGTNIYPAKQNWLNAMRSVAFGHPCCVGFLTWAFQGPSPDGDWGLLNIPASPFSPTSDWSDTVASIDFASFGQANRDQKLNFTATGTPTITSTATAVPLTCVTGGLTVPTEANFTNSQLFGVTCPISLTGTISISGDPSTPYRIRFLVTDHYLSTVTVIGTPLLITGSATNAAISMTGAIPTAGMRADITIDSTITAGSVTGTITALNVTQTLGVAPALLTPVSTAVFGVL